MAAETNEVPEEQEDLENTKDENIGEETSRDAKETNDDESDLEESDTDDDNDEGI